MGESISESAERSLLDLQLSPRNTTHQSTQTTQNAYCARLRERLNRAKKTLFDISRLIWLARIAVSLGSPITRVAIYVLDPTRMSW